MSLDVVLREVHEQIERFCSKKGKNRGLYGRGVYISYDYFYYVNEYIKQINNTLGVAILDDEKDEDKREGELLKMNGKRHLIKSKCRALIICQIIFGPYNTSDYPITIVVIPPIYIVVPLLPPYCYLCAP